MHAEVDCIILDDGQNEIDESTLGWPDEVGDEKVDNMVKIINEDHSFCSEMFTGGSHRRGWCARFKLW